MKKLKLILLFLLLPILYFAQPYQSSKNSRTTNLDSAATFTGTLEEIRSDFSWIVVTVRSTQNGTGKLQFTNNNSSPVVWQNTTAFSYTANDTTTNKYYFPITMTYFRVVYTNDTVATTSFKLITTLLRGTTFPLANSTNQATLNSYISGAIDDHGNFITTPQTHNFIHLGKLFITGAYDADVDIAGPKQFLLITDSNEVHLTYEANATAGCTIGVYEGAVASDSGTITPIRNINRTSLDSVACTFYSDPTVTDSGTVIIPTVVIGTGGAPALSVPGVSRHDTEFALKPNTIYLFVITALSDNTKVSFTTELYEE